MTMDSHSAEEEEFTFPLEETSVIPTSIGRPPFLETASAMTSTSAMLVAAATQLLTSPNCQDTMLVKAFNQAQVGSSCSSFTKKCS